MDLSTSTPTQRRRSLRRAVHLDCAVLSDLWSEVAPHLATDLSPEGVWLSTQLPLEPGSEVVVSFRPPRWPTAAPPVTALAEVARVGLPRRRGDRLPAGMGLYFIGLEDDERDRLALSLRGLPPPLPGRAGRVCGAAVMGETEIIVEGGRPLHFTAEGPLLTAGRPRPTQLALARSQILPLPPRRRSYRFRPASTFVAPRTDATDPALAAPGLRLVAGS